MADLPEKQPNESEFEYHKRLIYGKAIDKTLLDIDYSELAPVLYGEKYSSDHTRKMIAGSAKTLMLLEKEGEKELTQSVLSDVDRKTIELQKQKVRFQDQRREFNKLVTSQARFEHLTEEILAQMDKLPELKKYERMVRKVKDSDAVDVVLVLSDWHYGMTADNIFNKFDKEIFKSRFDSMLLYLKCKLKKMSIRNIDIILLGDMIHGGIHVNTRIASDELVCDQLIQVSEYLSVMINEVSAFAGNNVHVYSTYGNHARSVSSKSEAIHRDNFERLIPWWLEQRLKDNKKIDFVESPNEFIYFNVCGNDIVATHGDLDNVARSTKSLYTLFGKACNHNVDYVLLGHRHHFESVEDMGITTIGCGSLCGSDEFANSKRLYSKPEQLMMTFSVADECLDAIYHLDIKKIESLYQI